MDNERILQPKEADGLVAPDERFVHFQTLLIRVNEWIATATEMTTLFQVVCDLIVEWGQFQLASVAVPKVDGTFRYYGSAGAIGYLDQVFITIDEQLPEGKGPMGTAWRGDHAAYNDSFQENPKMVPWVPLAEHYGLRSSASLPIHRGGRKWGILTVYHGATHLFNDAMKVLLETLAFDLSRGVDRIDLEAIHHHYTEHTLLGMAMVRHDQLVHVNRRWLSIMGYDDPNELIGQSLRLLFPDDATQHVIFNGNEWLQHHHNEMPPVGFAMRRKDGQHIWVELSISVLPHTDDLSEELTIWTIQDMTERYKINQQLEQVVLVDRVTALPNRMALEMQIPALLRHAREQHTSVVVGLLDIDHFREVNEQYGHDMGDQVLRELTCRLQACLQTGDVLARWGGDELALVMGYDVATLGVQDLMARMNTLHHAVEFPFSVGSTQEVLLEISVGLAGYPLHGQEGEQLLRTADMAMYQVKATKGATSNWWQWGWDEASEMTPLLSFHFPISEMVDTVYDEMVQDPTLRAVYASLSEAEFRHLKEQVLRHLTVLLHEQPTEEEMKRTAQRVGEVHALVGIRSKDLTKATARYTQLMTEQLYSHATTGREFLRSLLDHRLQLDLQMQLQVQEQTIYTYLEVFDQTAQDKAQDLLIAIGQLPGIVGVLRYRLHAHEGFIVDAYAGKQGKAIQAVMSHPSTRVEPYTQVGWEHSLLAETWLGATIQTLPALQRDARFASRHEALRQLGSRSVMMVPLLDDQGNPFAVISVYGAYPHQFESRWMQVFARGVQQAGQARWGSHLDTVVNRTPMQIKAYRSLLFHGGLNMHLQPIIDLQTGTVLKWEALARLQTKEYTMIPPDQFLPLLGEAELERVFELGFERVVQWLMQGSEPRETTTKVSLNLPPSLLQRPELITWIQDTLARYDCPPERLFLELLETKGMDLQALESKLMKVVAMGISLAMDDFGTGESNFLRLATLPFQMVKIDRSLLIRLSTHPQATLTLLGSLIQIGRELGWEVVVEGIETLAVAEAVLLLGARYGQGYYFAKPMPMEQVRDWISTFSCSLSPNWIHTPLGALAYLITHQRRRRQTMLREEDCPVTHFFISQGWQASEGMTLHHRLHEGDHAPHLFKSLLRWMEAQLITQ